MDENINVNKWYMLFMVVCLCFAIYPCVLSITNWLYSANTNKTENSNPLEKACFVGIVIIWLLGYLAMFPGVYAVDAHAWYQEFSSSVVPITDRWSPVYAGLFYLFVESGKRICNSYETGLAFFGTSDGFFIDSNKKNLIASDV